MAKVINLQSARVTMAAANNVGTIHIYGQIGRDFWGDGIDPKDFLEELEALGNVARLDIRIHSYGGYVYEGQAIASAIRRHKAETHIFVDGIAASMASVILMEGDYRYIAKNGSIMIHDPLSFCIGNLSDMEKCAEGLRNVKEQLLDAYEANSDLDREELSVMMTEETWFDSAQALANGFVHEIGDDVSDNVGDFQNLEPYRMAASANLKKLVPNLALESTSDNSETNEAEAMKPEKKAPGSEGTENTSEADIAAATQAAITAEGERQTTIRSLAQTGVEDLIETCLADTDCTAGDAAIKVAQAVKALRETEEPINSRRKQSNASSEQELDEHEIKKGKNKAETPEEKWAANEDNVQDEFDTQADYLGYCKALGSGRLKHTSSLAN